MKNTTTDNDFNQMRMKLGSLCSHAHEHEETGKSLRYKTSGNCITCHKLRGRKNYAENKDKWAEAYRLNHCATIEKVERRKQQTRDHYKKHRDEICARNREKYAKNLEESRKENREKYKKRREKVLAKARLTSSGIIGRPYKKTPEEIRRNELKEQNIKPARIKHKKRIAPVAIPKEEQFVSLKKQISKIINL